MLVRYKIPTLTLSLSLTPTLTLTGDDAQADLSQCGLSGWEVLSNFAAQKREEWVNVDGCNYFGYKIYSCKSTL